MDNQRTTNLSLSFIDKLTAILACQRCGSISSSNSTKLRSPCAHLLCGKCTMELNNGCSLCEEGTENGQKVIDDLFNLRSSFHKLALTTEFKPCVKCRKETRLGELWACENCNATNVCSKCIVGICDHAKSGNPPKTVETLLLEKGKEIKDQSRALKGGIESVTKRVGRLSGRIDVIRNQVNGIGSLAPAFGQMFGEFRRELDQVINVDLPPFDRCPNDLDAIADDHCLLWCSFPGFDEIAAKISEIQRQFGEIDEKTRTIEASFYRWLQCCQSFGNVLLAQVCAIEQQEENQ